MYIPRGTRWGLRRTARRLRDTTYRSGRRVRTAASMRQGRSQIEAEIRLTATANILDPVGAEAAVELLEKRRRRLAVDGIVTSPPRERVRGGMVTDTSLLSVISYHLVRLEADEFGRRATELLSNLEQRAETFEIADFSDQRLLGWCSALNNLCGAVHLANRHFLYRLGRTLEDAETVVRLERLVIKGVLELDRRSDWTVSGPQEWAEALDEPGALSKLRLANAVNYLARDAYALESATPLGGLATLLESNHFDILIRSATFAMIPFTRSSDPLYDALTNGLDELERYLCGLAIDQPGWWRASHETDEHVAHRSLLAVFLRASEVLVRDEAIDRIQAKLDLEPSELPGGGIRVLPSDLAHLPSGTAVTPMTDRLDSRLGQPVTVSARLQRARLLQDLGFVAEARTLLPSRRETLRLSLGDLHVYLGLVGSLLGRHETEYALFEVRNRLQAYSAEALNNVNVIGRMIQYGDLVDDLFTMENANVAFDGLYRPSGRAQSHPKHFTLIVADQDRVTPSLLAPISALLRAEGMEFRNLQINRLDNRVIRPWVWSPRLSANTAALEHSAVLPGGHHKDWEIDLPNRRVMADGLNYYQGLYERTARVLKVYNVDWDLPAARVYFRQWLRQVDRVVAALDEVQLVAERDDLQIRLVSLQSHFAPFSALRRYAEGHPDRFQHITMSSSYENWKTNVGGEPLSTLAIQNNTLPPYPSLPAFGTRAGFEKWFQQEFLPDQEDYQRRSQELTSLKRAGSDPVADHFVEQMRADKAEGRTVFCLLGKIPYDLAVPYQGGPAHTSMSDWLNHTVTTISVSDNRLYIKPHPHEMNVAISAKTIESFVGLIDDVHSPHLTVLPHRGINVQDLIGEVDVFLCWNGSAIAELGAQGTAVLAADDWAVHNYPIHVLLPDSREHYERLLRGQEPVVMHPQFQLLSAAYTCYLTDAPFAIQYPYVHRSSTNTLFNVATVSFDRLAREGLAALEERTSDIREAFGLGTPVASTASGIP